MHSALLWLSKSSDNVKDFGYRATHLMTVRGKEIVQAFYLQKAKTAYFFGCSTGGQNALMEAQLFREIHTFSKTNGEAGKQTALACHSLRGLSWKGWVPNFPKWRNAILP
jgi:feruloyl esterase